MTIRKNSLKTLNLTPPIHQDRDEKKEEEEDGADSDDDLLLFRSPSVGQSLSVQEKSSAKKIKWPKFEITKKVKMDKVPKQEIPKTIEPAYKTWHLPPVPLEADATSVMDVRNRHLFSHADVNGDKPGFFFNLVSKVIKPNASWMGNLTDPGSALPEIIKHAGLETRYYNVNWANFMLHHATLGRHPRNPNARWRAKPKEMFALLTKIAGYNTVQYEPVYVVLARYILTHEQMTTRSSHTPDGQVNEYFKNVIRRIALGHSAFPPMTDADLKPAYDLTTYENTITYVHNQMTLRFILDKRDGGAKKVIPSFQGGSVVQTSRKRSPFIAMFASRVTSGRHTATEGGFEF